MPRRTRNEPYDGPVVTTDDGSPRLDRSVEPWLGTFPGLGSITVADDGSVTVEPDPDSDEVPALLEAALRYGWAEGLSWTRRGFQLAAGAAVAPPGEGEPLCLLLTGDPHDVVIVIADLVTRGWTVLGDRFTPVAWQGSLLVAHPREAPILMARRRATKLQVDGTPVRADTDCLIFEAPRQPYPAAVLAVAQVAMRRPQEDPLEPLLGQQRFEAAAGLMMGGVLAPEGDVDPDDDEAVATLRSETLAEHLRLAALPICRMRIESATVTTDVDSLLEWWHDVAGNGTEGGDQAAGAPAEAAV